MDEADIARLLKHDFSQMNEQFAEQLLQRALAVLGKGDVIELSDEDLEMLAAAGNVDALLADDDDKAPLV